jgi:hypothetical protein
LDFLPILSKAPSTLLSAGALQTSAQALGFALKVE